MNTESIENPLMKKYGTAFNTIAMFAGLEVYDVLASFEKRIHE